MVNLKEPLSPHFLLKEFSCPCCGMVKTDDCEIKALEQLRGLAARPVRIVSGFRCIKHNGLVGGSPFSQHLYGRAADVVIYGLTSQKICRLAVQVNGFKQGGIGCYPQSLNHFAHVDTRGNGPHRWAMIGGEVRGMSEDEFLDFINGNDIIA